MWGNSFWLGGERACHLLNDPPTISLIKSAARNMYENVTKIASEIPVEYRMFYIRHTSPLQFDPDLFNKSILHLGLCFPKSCDDSQANYMATKVVKNRFQSDVRLGHVRYLGTKTLVIRDNFISEPFVVLLL